jgi:hypothetical protein
MTVCDSPPLIGVLLMLGEVNRSCVRSSALTPSAPVMAESVKCNVSPSWFRRRPNRANVDAWRSNPRSKS